MVSAVLSSLPSPSALWNSPQVSACRSAVSAVFQRGREAFSSYASRPFSSLALAYDIYHRPSFPVATTLHATALFTIQQVIPFFLRRAVHAHYTVAAKCLSKFVNRKVLTSCLVKAVEKADHVATELLIQAGADVNQPDERGRTLLQSACFYGWNDWIPSLLLDHGAPVNLTTAQVDLTPLMCAASGGRVDTARLLLRKGAHATAPAPNQTTALHHACAFWQDAAPHEQQRAKELIDLLMEHGADPFAANHAGITPLFLVTREREEFLSVLLYQAVAQDNPPLIQRLLDAGADVNRAMVHATNKGRIDVVSSLLRRGARATPTTSNQPTAFYEACAFWQRATSHEQQRAKELIDLLMEHRADPFAANYAPITPLSLVTREREEFLNILLCHAVTQNNLPLTQRLLDARADVNRVHSRRGMTPLSIACLEGHRDMVSLLLDRGAEVDPVDNNPLYGVLADERFEIAELLIRRGANPARLVRFSFGAGRSLVGELLLLDNLNGAAFLVQRFQDRLPEADVRAFYSTLFPPRRTVPDDYRPPDWLPNIPSPLTPPTGTTETIDATATGNALRSLRSDASLQDILRVLLRDPRFTRAWERAGRPTLEEVGDEAFIVDGVSVFPRGWGAQCDCTSNKIQINRDARLFYKIQVLIFETMNLVQKENFLLLDRRRASEQLGREEYTQLTERIEYNSEIWTREIHHSLGLTDAPIRNFSQVWGDVQKTHEGAHLSHADNYRSIWDKENGRTFLATKSDEVRKRADELRARRRFGSPGKAPHG